MWVVLKHPLVVTRAGDCVLRLVVDPRACSRPSGREPVDRNLCQDFIVGPRVAVGPVVELLVDPCQQPHRRVCEGCSNRRWSGCLFDVVAQPLFEEPVCPREPSFLRLGAREEILEIKQGLLDRRCVGTDVVQVRCDTLFGVLSAYDPSYCIAPVATLGHYMSEVSAISPRKHARQV